MTDSSRAALKLHGRAGLLIIFLAEALLFSGNQVVGRWFTPIVWTGYILYVLVRCWGLGARDWGSSDLVCPQSPSTNP
jgi:hypothetical protein